MGTLFWNSVLLLKIWLYNINSRWIVRITLGEAERNTNHHAFL